MRQRRFKPGKTNSKNCATRKSSSETRRSRKRSDNSSTLRIRERVTEPYVVRGGFHILANSRPLPRVYWHPRFLSRVGQLLGDAE
nr:ABC-three component system protein [Herbaspirillum camelliae]